MSRPLRVVFAGTPDFAVPHLAACRRDGVEIAAVYTQPDRPAGRGRKLTPSPVKQAALDFGLPVEQPEQFKDAAARARLATLAPDLLVVVAYGLILPRKVLAIPHRGCWNVHASLLPRWRGAAPIQRAILAGDNETGVCLMQMEAGLDTGPVLLRRAIPIAPADTGGSLHDKLAALGAGVLGEGLDHLVDGAPLAATPQPEDGVVYAHKLDKAEARLDWNEPATALARKVRAFDPWPVAEAVVAGEALRVWRAEHRDLGPGTRDAGDILAATREGIDVACADGVLRLLEVQRAGGRRIAAADYVNARPELKRAAVP
ncbi:MAG: methionyl-tRNA formyltransferase [Proteobacteria bacterium]|uniref:methionyl-tRNA formyltransferase n=1 Tax=Rudaea sp. TaxID=2136325 RepID=UPI001D3CBCE3|nr:methionyl-tRNA formyltransferase [Pseudomonadota bacterium]MBS0567556.1 methionyl-tRNA formyltransferase [Pseudomonadota bacterium]